MDSKDLTSIVDQLKTQQSHLAGHKNELQRQLADIESELARVGDAIAALTSSGKSGAKRGKPSANRDAVREAVRFCLAEKGQVQEDELKLAVGKKLASDGLSRSGLALRMKEVLAEEEFVHSPDGYRFAGLHHPVAPRHNRDFVTPRPKGSVCCPLRPSPTT